MAAAVITLAASSNKQRRRPLWSELLVGLEWATLKISPVYYGINVPRGDGAPVVLVPGFMGSDQYLLEMHLWLGRMGYRSYLSGIGRNADCPDVLMERLLETMARAQRETGRQVRLIGHSLGGLLARAAAVRQPHQVAQVITMASPFRRLSAHPLVLSLVRLVRGKALERNFGNTGGSCERSFLEAVEKRIPESVTRAAIFTKSDPVVDWRDCVEADADLNIEVSGTHVGLPINAQVYREVAQLLRLAQPVPKAGSIDPQTEYGLPLAA
ncbi:MAG: alpha/beta hydrolase [Chloroflexi bacterium]|nr:alpha/beta hydrolase [Chloroflexota bacterium]